MRSPWLPLTLALMALVGCTGPHPAPRAEPPASDDPAALRAQADQLRVMADQFDQQAAVFRHQLPTGQPIIQRKAVSADNLRARADQLDAKARRIEHARAGVPDSPDDLLSDGFDSRYLAEELRELAALRRGEAEQLQGDPASMAEKDSLADQLEALAAEVERRSHDSNR